jgi:hypothetical protein
MEKIFRNSIGGSTAYWVSDEKMNPIRESVIKEDIKAILVLGSSAILRWDQDFCRANQGKVMSWNFANQMKIPFLITRSPEALSFAKSKSEEEYLKISSEMKDHIKKLINLAGDI